MTSLQYEQLVSIIGLMGLWTAYYQLWKPNRVSNFRQRLFAIRAELFDLAADGEIAFDDPTYLRLRFLINGMVRYAHRLSFPVLVVSTLIMKEEPAEDDMRWNANLASVPSETRKKLIQLHARAIDACTMHLVFGSVVLTFLFIARAILTGFRIGAALLFGSKKLRTLSSEAFHRKVAALRMSVTRTSNKEISPIEARVLFEERQEQRRRGYKPLVPVAGFGR